MCEITCEITLINGFAINVSGLIKYRSVLVSQFCVEGTHVPHLELRYDTFPKPRRNLRNRSWTIARSGDLARKLEILMRDYASASSSVRRVNAEFAGRKITQVDRAESRP